MRRPVDLTQFPLDMWKCDARAVYESNQAKIELPGLDTLYVDINTRDTQTMLNQIAYQLAMNIRPMNYFY